MTGGLHARLEGRRGAWSLDARLHAPPGAVTLLTGASGAGKTTLLRAVAGLERLAGEVRLDGDTWQAEGVWLPPHRRGVGLVFQQGALFPHLSASENLAYAARRSGLGARDVDEAAERFGMSSLLERGVGGLSGGERRRVAIVRALLSRPRVLLLDEPLAGLDPDAKREVGGALREVLPALSAPVVWVAHEPSDLPLTPARRLDLRDGALHDETGVDMPGAAP